MPTLPAEYLHSVYRSIAERFGASPEEAEIFADCTLLPDLRGHATQGLAFLPMVYPLLRDGLARFGAPIRMIREGPGFAIVDGGLGVGQVVATRAMALAIDRAQRDGVASVWVRHTNDFTMASIYALQALVHDCVGVAMSNGAPLVAPWGGRDKMFSTNPIAVAVPAGRELPIVIDMSSSALSHGQVVLAARDGRLVPDRLLVDESGGFTDDPRPLVADPRHRESPLLGAILPQGPKGFGWLLIVELFAGLLSGMNPSYLNVFPPTSEHPSAIGHFLMAIDVNALMPINQFKAKVDDLITTIKASRLAQGFDAIVLPGERAAREEARRRREGVPIRDEEWREVIEIARAIGLDLDALRWRAEDLPQPG
jgi:LDH2 family malate/lactate/ureidoglycolate dehydrogenase